MSRTGRAEVVVLDDDRAGQRDSEAGLLTAIKTPPIALQCPYCAKESFASLAALSLHVQTLHGTTDGPPTTCQFLRLTWLDRF